MDGFMDELDVCREDEKFQHCEKSYILGNKDVLGKNHKS